MTGNEGLTYGYTQTLKPCYYGMSVVMQLYTSFKDMQSLFDRKLRITDYKIYVEFTKEGNVHYHGVLFGCDKARILRYKHLFTQQLGFCSFVLNNNYEKLMKYITKDIELARKVFPRITMPLTKNTMIKLTDRLHDLNDRSFD